jgi:hypothetical protein
MDHIQSLQNLFQDQMYIIPDYQRSYAWDEKQWEDLWEDLDVLGSGRKHYAGTLVIKPDRANIITDDYGETFCVNEVVDGQQRLTTLLILLDVLAEQYNSMGNDKLDKLAASIQRRYLQTEKDGQPRLKLTLNNDTNGYWQSRIICKTAPPTLTPENRSQERLTESREFFTSQIEELRKASTEVDFINKLDELRQKITTQLQMTVYQVEDDSDVGVIFEVMNNRGKPLTGLEKTKNYLLYLCDKLAEPEDASLSRSINETWTSIYEKLMSAGMPNREDDFLRYNWLVFMNHRTKEWLGSDSVRKKFSQWRLKEDRALLAIEIREYVQNLEYTITPYCDILRPEMDKAFDEVSDQSLRSEIIEYSNKLIRLSTTAAFIPALIAVRLSQKDQGQEYLELLKACELYAFCVFKLKEKRSHTGKSKLYRAAFDYREGSISFDELMSVLRGELTWRCSRSEFEAEIEKPGNWYHWDGIRYLLFEYELYIAKKQVMHVSWQDFANSNTGETVEHILPQTATKQYWRRRWKKPDRAVALHDIGNLVWVTPTENSRLGNKGFDEKKDLYRDSELYAAKELGKRYDEWTFMSYIERREAMLNWMRERWFYEDASTGNPPDNNDDTDSEGDVDE